MMEGLLPYDDLGPQLPPDSFCGRHRVYSVVAKLVSFGNAIDPSYVVDGRCLWSLATT